MPYPCCLQALECVSQPAVERAKALVLRMLHASPVSILQRMQQHNAAVGIFGRQNCVTGAISLPYPVQSVGFIVCGATCKVEEVLRAISCGMGSLNLRVPEAQY
jgi:hypothetical protein